MAVRLLKDARLTAREGCELGEEPLEWFCERGMVLRAWNVFEARHLFWELSSVVKKERRRTEKNERKRKKEDKRNE